VAGRIDIASLNPRQAEAVRQTEGALLVLAGAGSGKTRVITTRIGHLLCDRGVEAEQILAVTFTNKAAREMQERVEELVGRQAAKGMVISTFHSLGVRILRRDIHRLGYRRNFTIYSSSDQVGLVRQLARELDTERRFDPEALIWKISGAKNRLVRPEEYQPRYSDDEELMVKSLYPRYQRQLRAFNAVDFDDIIMLSVQILEEHPEARDHWQQKFRYIMVDEYQDTNAPQYRLISTLALGHGNLCVVGDDDQSIYGWRGANVENILDFEKEYPGCRVVKLEQNYRSTGTILEAANYVIRNNGKRKEKRLWTSSGSGSLIDLVIAQDEEEEATLVVERVQRERFKNGLAYGDCAVLYRTNAQSRALEEQLRYEGIPYILIGGMQFYERKEVKDALCWLKALANPADEMALLRIINFPRRGIGEGSVLRIGQWADEQGVEMLEALARVDEIEGLAAGVREKVREFHALLEEERALFSSGRQLADKARCLFKRIAIEEELYRIVNDGAQARRKMENVEQVVSSLAAYEGRELLPSLAGFLEKVTLLDEDRFAGREKKAPEGDAVTLMSLHSSKGLEFPFVFLVGMEEEILPHRKSVEEGISVDEERRLCYVGITRARRQLVLSRCLQRKRYGKLEERYPSRFLAEIPGELLSHQLGAAATTLSAEENDRMADTFFARMREMMEG
jgi:superfamily I DNA/RNA helicase